MKKLYFLTLMFVTTISLSQTTIFNSAGGGSYPTGWTDSNNVSTQPIDKTSYYLIEAGSPADIIETDVYDLSAYSSAILNIDVATYGSGTANPAQIEVSYDGGNNYTDLTNTNTPSSSTYIAGGPINLSTVSNQVKIRISTSATSGRGVRLRNIKLEAYGTDPDLTITSPTNATSFNPTITNVNVSFNVLNFNVANGTGDGHIVYNINNGTSTDKFDTTDINIPVTAGQSYTVNLELVDNTGASLSTPVTASVNFTIEDYTTVTNIGAIRTDVIANGAGKYYHLNSEALVTYTRPANRNQKYIQDASAGILIDDNSNVITNTFNIGDGMTGFKGQTSLYNGVLQIIPLEDIAPSSNNNSITPEVVTISDITSNIEAYESELVQINGITFADGNGTNTFAVNTNYDITDSNTMTFRTMFAEADYVTSNEVIPSGSTNIIVLVAEFNGTAQVVARSLADVTLSNDSFHAIEGLKMYPNPLSGNILNISSTANTTMAVQIFDILGKEVLKGNVINNTFNTGSLNKGVYIVKINEEGKTATRKLVIK